SRCVFHSLGIMFVGNEPNIVKIEGRMPAAAHLFCVRIPDKECAILAEGMTNAKFVENIGIGNGDIGDGRFHIKDVLKHVPGNAASLMSLISADGKQTSAPNPWNNHFGIDYVKINCLWLIKAL